MNNFRLNPNEEATGSSPVSRSMVSPGSDLRELATSAVVNVVLFLLYRAKVDIAKYFILISIEDPHYQVSATLGIIGIIPKLVQL